MLTSKRSRAWFLALACILTLALPSLAQGYQTTYELSMPQPQTHYFHVRMTIRNIQGSALLPNKDQLTLKMPVWTPGSYLVREFAKNVDKLTATSANQKLPVRKTNKNTWQVSLSGANEVVIEYDVYAFELSVRTSFIDDSHGYVNGASVFMYVPQLVKTPLEVLVKPFEKWSTVSTAMKSIGKWRYEADDYDLLVDSPIEIGNHLVIPFESMGIPHEIAMYSLEPLVFDQEDLIKKYKAVVEAAKTVVGEHPCDRYLFIIHHLPGIGGGLEHLYSTTCQTSPTVYQNPTSTKRFFSLIAHEYFHLWNVKRIRPIELGPFDYDSENYTTLLWVSEGFTSFYQNDILRRAGIISEKEFGDDLVSSINQIENQPGQRIQSVAESSWDAWIKYYRPNENSNNTTVSYYTKGGVLGLLLNLEILGATKGEKSLDDVFKYLWKTYYIEANRGFSEEEFQKAVEKIAGKSMKSFFERYVYGTDEINYNAFFAHAGVQLVDQNVTKNQVSFGAATRGKTVSRVDRDSPAYLAGINVNDQILKINGVAFTSVADAIAGKKAGDILQVEVQRAGVTLTYPVTLTQDKSVSYMMQRVGKITPDQEKVYKKLMHL